MAMEHRWFGAVGLVRLPKAPRCLAAVEPSKTDQVL